MYSMDVEKSISDKSRGRGGMKMTKYCPNDTAKKEYPDSYIYCPHCKTRLITKEGEHWAGRRELSR